MIDHINRYAICSRQKVITTVVLIEKHSMYDDVEILRLPVFPTVILKEAFLSSRPRPVSLLLPHLNCGFEQDPQVPSSCGSDIAHDPSFQPVTDPSVRSFLTNKSRHYERH